MSDSQKLTDLFDSLDFFDFSMPIELNPPTDEEISMVEQTAGEQAAKAVMEDYWRNTSRTYYSCGIRPGCVLKLKTGGYLLVGHVSEHLGYLDDTPFVDLSEIESIAYLY